MSKLNSNIASYLADSGLDDATIADIVMHELVLRLGSAVCWPGYSPGGARAEDLKKATEKMSKYGFNMGVRSFSKKEGK